MTDLSHIGPDGAVRMVDVGAKPLSRRRAVARATVLMAPETVARLGELPKGDALTTAQLAGIMAAKQTPALIPLCHPILISRVSVELSLKEPDHVEIAATVRSTGPKGGVTVGRVLRYDVETGALQVESGERDRATIRTPKN